MVFLSFLHPPNSNLLIPVKKSFLNQKWNDGTSPSSIYKLGRICIAQIDGYTTTDWSNGTIIATLPSDCIPISTISSMCLSNVSPYTPFSVLVHTNGYLYSMLTNTDGEGTFIAPSTSWIRASLVWITEN